MGGEPVPRRPLRRGLAARGRQAALDYGATAWSFYRAHDGRLDFLQTATFPTKAAWERYWYSEEISEKRAELAGYYQVRPSLLPTLHEVLGRAR